MSGARVIQGGALERLRELDAGSAQVCVTSPPYWGLRDYGADGQIGLEETPEAYVARLVAVFEEVRRVLADDGCLWLNLGDSYAAGKAGRTDHDRPYGRNKGSPVILRKPPPGLKPKDLVGIPWRVAFALQSAGWYLRSDVIWAKPNPMPESVTDRPTKAHEYIFLMTKAARYFYDADATSLDVRNARTVWAITPKPYSEAHFATFPPELPRRCILASTRRGDVVLDPFAGSGTTGAVALSEGREALLIELNPDYCKLIEQRLARVTTGVTEREQQQGQAALFGGES